MFARGYGAFLLNLPEFEGEQDHSLRTTVIVPWTEAMRVAERYNLDALTTFNMTEVSSPLMSDLHPNTPGQWKVTRYRASGRRK